MQNLHIEGTDATVQDRLIAAATEVFNRKGYSAASVREIVAAAGVTKPVLYYYFGNKEGIYLAILQKALEEFVACLEVTRRAEGSIRERLQLLYDDVFARFRRHIEIVRLIYSVYYGPPQGAPAFDFDVFRQRFHEALRELVEEGVRRGEFRNGDAESMALALHGAGNVCLEVELAHPEMAVGREGLVQVLSVVFEGILAHKEHWKE